MYTLYVVMICHLVDTMESNINNLTLSKSVENAFGL